MESSAESQECPVYDKEKRQAMLENIRELDDQYEEQSKIFSYGTAGFRDKGKLLNRVFFRLGIAVAMRSK
jgi:hypothetical protein